MFPLSRGLALGTLLTCAALAQEPPAPEIAVCRPDRIEVKLCEGTGAVLDADGRLGSRAGVDLATVSRLFARAARVERCVGLPLEVLDRWHREADERLRPGLARPGHLGLWFRLHCTTSSVAQELLELLRADRHVQEAHLEPIASLCGLPVAIDDIPPPTPDLTSWQTYKAAAPSGFGFDATAWIGGGRGEFATVFHAESDWTWDHEDFALTAADFIGPVTNGTGPGASHGTAVVGVIASQRNGFGMTGVVDRARLHLVPVAENGGFASAIALAVLSGAPGDVITLIGSYNLQMVKPRDEVPLEYYQVNFDAILAASTQGVIVVSSAANGDNDLDDSRFARRFDLTVRDSGAILVAATEGAQLARASFSNYGSRIDTNAWGNDVATTGYGTLFAAGNDPRQTYTEHGAGTSSATAITTGVVARLVSTMRAQLGRAPSPGEVRRLLRGHGTPVAGDIGTRSDLVGMLAAVGLPDGLALDRAEVPLGGRLTATMRGAPGGSFGLALSFGRAHVELGLDRPLHLDPTLTITVGGFALVSGQAQWSATVPNDPAVADLELYLQGVTVDPGRGSVHVTNSVQFWMH